jgi:hypothetical protein
MPRSARNSCTARSADEDYLGRNRSSWVVRRIFPLVSDAIRNPEEPVCTVRFVRMDFTLSDQRPRFRPRNVTIIGKSSAEAAHAIAYARPRRRIVDETSPGGIAMCRSREGPLCGAVRCGRGFAPRQLVLCDSCSVMCSFGPPRRDRARASD